MNPDEDSDSHPQQRRFFVIALRANGLFDHVWRESFDERLAAEPAAEGSTLHEVVEART